MQLSESREAALQGDLAAARRRADEIEARLADANRQFDDDREDWKELCRDLQTAVVVAETYRSEAQDAANALTVENRTLRDLVDSLTRQLNPASAAQSYRFDGNGSDVTVAGSALQRQQSKSTSRPRESCIVCIVL